MDPSRNRQAGGKKPGGKKTDLGSTTSLGKRRSLHKRAQKTTSPANNTNNNKRGQQNRSSNQPDERESNLGSEGATRSTMSNPKSSEYGSQASPLRVPTNPSELNKVTILGAAGGIGQPLALLLMLHSEYIQHLALYDLVNVHGVGADLAHVDRQCKVTTHLGQNELAEAVRGAKVIVIPAGLAQKPGMSRDDLFGSNAKIMYNLAKVCAQVAPEAQLAIISNPVNSLVPLICEVYHQVLSGEKQGKKGEKSLGGSPGAAQAENNQQQANSPGGKTKSEGKPTSESKPKSEGRQFDDCFRRIFGVTTLDVVRASTLTARSPFFKPDPSGLFKDPTKITMPVVGGHAGKTILPLLSQCQPKLDKKRLQEDKVTTHTLIEQIQQAGIEVLNAKKGTGSATLAMAYAACRFTISLLRALQGETNIVECAYVRHQHQMFNDLDYFATPLQLGKEGYVKSLGLGKLLPYEQQMVNEAVKELRHSVAKGEDFARERLSAERP